VQWLDSRPDLNPAAATEYRNARSSEQLRIAEDLEELPHYGRSAISRCSGARDHLGKDCLHRARLLFMHSCLSELDRYGKTTPGLFEKINLKIGAIRDARNALGRNPDDNSARSQPCLYGEMRGEGLFRFVNFGHPPPLVFSAEYSRFMDIDQDRMVAVPGARLEIPEDHPDRNKYFSMSLRKRQVNSQTSRKSHHEPGRHSVPVYRWSLRRQAMKGTVCKSSA